MKTSPVSFGTLMCFSIKKKPEVSTPDLLRLSFVRNPSLREYNLQDTFQYTVNEPDFTVSEAASNFGKMLDKLHKPKLPKGSKDVILTEANFCISPTDKKKKYFITAATNKDEEKIFEELRGTTEFYTVRVSRKER